MQLWALIVDSFRESLDRKIFWVLVIISLLVTAAMAAVAFEPTGINFAFGMWKIESELFDPSTDLGRGNIAIIAVSGMDAVLGWIGLMLAIVATAGFFPTMMERGAIDVLISKPMSRPGLFLGKYLGSMVFVFLQAVLFVGLTFVVMGVRWRVWLPGYLCAIPLLVVLFSYLYCVSVLTAVTTRSSIAAIFVCLGAWVVFSGLREADTAFEMNPAWKEERAIYHTIRTARWVVPKVQDITYLAERWSGAGSGVDLVPPGPETDPEMLGRLRGIEQSARNVSAVTSIGSSLAFEAMVLLLAIWRFSRKDF